MLISVKRGSNKYYRARIGDFTCKEDEEILAPPKGKASAGRCNPEGVSYLYLADDKYTAIAEVKPNKGDIVTVAEIETDELWWFNLSLYATDDEKVKEVTRINDEELIDLIKIINDDFKTVVTYEDKLSYLPLQYITEYVKSKSKIQSDKKVKIDGLMYNSTLGNGTNYVLFDWKERIKIIDKCIYKIDEVRYEIADL